MRKWEYVTCWNANEAGLSRFGLEGWELVNVVCQPNQFGSDLFYTFKRELGKIS